MSVNLDHFFFPSSKPRARKAKRYRLLGCGGCLGLVVLIFAMIGVSTVFGFGGGTPVSTDASSDPSRSATPTVSPTVIPQPAEPTGIDGEVLLGQAEGGTVEAVDGEAPREALSGDVEAMAALEALEVKGRAAKSGYDREQFGEAWVDVDGNDCDTRNDILYRDLSGAVTSDGCTVTRGTLDPSPYTDITIDFVRGPATSADVQIDHVVALSDAWQKGAQQLDASTRVMFANDPLNLLAVDGPTNQAKGDKDAASWLPPNRDFRCEYVATQVAVKAKYELWVTQAEKDAISRVLDRCDGQLLPEDQGVVTGAGAALDVSAATDDVYGEKKAETSGLGTIHDEPAPASGAYGNCSEAEADGVYNIPVGDPRYGAHLDPDSDGVGCENSGAVAVPSVPEVPAAPVRPPAPVAPGSESSYANCSAARAAGAAPVHVGNPGYGSHLDRDGDGVGCE